MVDGSFTGLCHLLISRNVEKTAILAEQGSSLLEVEGNIGINALLTDGEYPIIVAYAGITARLTSDSYLIAPATKISSEIDIL